MATKKDGINFHKTLMLIFMQKIKFSPSPLSSNIARVLQTCHFGYLVLDWPRPLKNSINMQEFDVYLHGKNILDLFFFLRYYTLNNPAI